MPGLMMRGIMAALGARYKDPLFWLLHSPRFYLLVQVVDPAALEVLVGDEQPVLERVREGLSRYQLAEHLAHLVHPEPIDEILGGRVPFKVSVDRMLGRVIHPSDLIAAQVYY